MSSQKAMLDGILAKLTADQSAGTVYDDVGGRIFQDQAPQDATLPLLVYSIITDLPWRFFESVDIEVAIQIDLFGDTGDQDLTTTNDRLFTLLDGAALTISGFTGAKMQNEERGVSSVEEDSIHIRSAWTLWANVDSA